MRGIGGGSGGGGGGSGSCVAGRGVGEGSGGGGGDSGGVVGVVVGVEVLVGSIGMVKYGQWWSVVVRVLGPMVVNTGFSNLIRQLINDHRHTMDNYYVILLVL